jgi:HB1, ASXL, restriction endonuclease HTH domain
MPTRICGAQGMPNSLTRKLQKRKALVDKIEHLSKELTELDQEIFPRIETLAAAIDGGSVPRPKLFRGRTLDTATKKATVDLEQLAERLTLAYSAKKVLEDLKRPMKTAEIYDELKRRGVQVNGKVPQNNLAAHLSHHANLFMSTPDGWRLRQAESDSEKGNAQTAH